ncbi:MAG: dicarboxylate/amino acid:cation symporter, partial [Lachnospiraceae bacterium]|nr:dicarboxylate/amino acid:cation symporter [Lachnospiraceae bacterium]
FPSNLFQPMVDSTMLQIIVIALFVGFGIIIAGEKGQLFSSWIDSVYEVFMVVMRGIIKVTPIAVFLANGFRNRRYAFHLLPAARTRLQR